MGRWLWRRRRLWWRRRISGRRRRRLSRRWRRWLWRWKSGRRRRIWRRKSGRIWRWRRRLLNGQIDQDFGRLIAIPMPNQQIRRLCKFECFEFEFLFDNFPFFVVVDVVLGLFCFYSSV